jgi:hypothetical protein
VTSTELVGPVRVMRLRDGTVLTVDVPRDTLDPRYMLCHGQHRTGCDCYEAERNEELNEYRAMWQEARDAAREICAGHPTWPDQYEWVVHGWTADPSNGGQMLGEYVPSGDCCQCTGYQIIRKAHL